MSVCICICICICIPYMYNILLVCFGFLHLLEDKNCNFRRGSYGTCSVSSKAFTNLDDSWRMHKAHIGVIIHTYYIYI